MIGFQHFSGALADNDAGSHGVTRCGARHNRSIGDSKVVDSKDLEIGINHRHCIPSHLGRTRLMPIGDGSIADEVYNCGHFQVTRHHLALGERTKCGGVAYLPTKLHASYCGFQIVRVGQGICLDLDGVVRVRSGQADLTSTLRPHDTRTQGPTTCRGVEFGGCLRAADRYLNLAGLQIRRIEIRIALPEKGCLTPVVTWSKRLPILPDATNAEMILKVLAHTRKMLHDGYSQAL